MALLELLRHIRKAYSDSEDFLFSIIDDLMHDECHGKPPIPSMCTIFTMTPLCAVEETGSLSQNAIHHKYYVMKVSIAQQLGLQLTLICE